MSSPLRYKARMRSLARILVLASLAVFVVSGFALAVSTTAMSVEMALADEGAMDMADGEGCDSGAADHMHGANCELVCNSLMLSYPDEQKTFWPPLAASFDLWAPQELAGRTGPPDPYPPRSLILS